MGSIALVVLLTLLVPAGSGDATQPLLVGGVLTVWAGLAWLALRRDAPSLAGIAVLSPWAWAMLFVGDFDDRLLSSDVVAIELNSPLLASFLAGAMTITYAVNLRLGDTGVNLGRNFTAAPNSVPAFGRRQPRFVGNRNGDGPAHRRGRAPR